MGVLTHLDLCSGIGGFAYALTRLCGGYRTVGYVEIDGYCQQVLQARMQDGRLDDAPIWDDIYTFDGTQYRGVDIITAGWPCQPFSLAGKRKGTADKRHLWPEIIRVIREAQPRWFLGENVPGLLSIDAGGVFGTVLRDLAACGYAVEWDCIPACAVGAPHGRDRVWIVAHACEQRRQQDARRAHGDESADERGTTEDVYEPASNGQGCRTQIVADAKSGRAMPAQQSRCGRIAEPSCEVADAASGGCARRKESNGRRRAEGRASGDRLGDAITMRELQPQGSEQDKRGWIGDPGWWNVEPDVGRVADGIPARVDRLRGLGNAIVPQVAAWIARRILECEDSAS